VYPTPGAQLCDQQNHQLAGILSPSGGGRDERTHQLRLGAAWNKPEPAAGGGTALDRFGDALTAHNYNPRGTAARCPAHDDRRPSLSFGPASQFPGIVVNCQAGCPIDDILAALGLTPADLFDEPRQSKQGRAAVAEYPYIDEAGTVLYVKQRYWPKDFRQYVPLPDGGKQWSLNGVRRVLYRLPEVKAAIADSRSVFVAEGEKDAHALVAAGVVATCNTEGAAKPGQTPKWRKEYTEQLPGAMVTVVADKDDTGRAHAKHIVNELTGVAAHVRLVEPLSGKDAHDHLQAGWRVDEFVEVFDQQLQANDPPFQPNIAAAVGQIYAGVTPQSAAQANLCTVEEITHALALPAAKLIEPTSEWDAVDLLAAESRDTPDILAGAIPVGLTLISAAHKVGKTRFLAQVSVAAVRGNVFLERVVTQTKVLTLALEDGARRYRKSLHYLVGTNWPGRSELTVRTTSARLDEGGLTQIQQHLDKHPDCGLVIIDVLARVRPRGRGQTSISSTTTPWHRSKGWRTSATWRSWSPITPTNAPTSPTSTNSCQVPPSSSVSSTA
jgi:hypothetical protein